MQFQPFYVLSVGKKFSSIIECYRDFSVDASALATIAGPLMEGYFTALSKPGSEENEYVMKGKSLSDYKDLLMKYFERNGGHPDGTRC